jgi:hypothetical protein
MIPTKEILEHLKPFINDDVFWNAVDHNQDELAMLRNMCSQNGIQNSDDLQEEEKNQFIKF